MLQTARLEKGEKIPVNKLSAGVLKRTSKRSRKEEGERYERYAFFKKLTNVILVCF